MMWMTNSVSFSRRRAFSESFDETDAAPYYAPQVRNPSVRNPSARSQSVRTSQGPRSPPTPIEELPEVFFPHQKTEVRSEELHQIPRRRRTLTSPPQMNLELSGELPTSHVAHKDFLPKVPKGITDPPDTFGSLLQKANSWLKDHPDLDLFSCETVSWSSTEGVPFFSDSTVISSAPGGRKVKVTCGLRLWCYPKDPKAKQPEIGFKDYEIRDSIIATLRHINEDISKCLLNGRISRVETNYKLEGSTTDATSWLENPNSNRKYQAYLRLFNNTNDAPTQNAELVLRDFCPKFDSRSPHNNGWQKFEDLFPVVASWVNKKNNHFRLLSMHSFNVQLSKNVNTEKLHHSTLWENFIYKHLGAGKQNEDLTIIRIAYLRPTCADMQVIDPTRSHISYKTFTPHGKNDVTDPAEVTDKHFEELRSLVGRAKEWLEASGAKLQHIETIAVPYRQTIENAKVDPELTFLSTTPVKNVPSPAVICLRLYIEKSISRTRRDSQTQTSNSSTSEEEKIHL